MSLPLDVVGLLVGRLKGSMVRATEPLLGRSDKLVGANTIIGDKMSLPRSLLSRTMKHDAYPDRDGWLIRDSFHEIVLRSSAQCLPMVKFNRALQDHKKGRQCIQYLQDSLQRIMDRHFNKGMVSSDIHDAPIITRPVSTVRAGATGMMSAACGDTARATLLSASWVPPRAAPAFVCYCNNCIK